MNWVTRRARPVPRARTLPNTLPAAWTLPADGRTLARPMNTVGSFRGKPTAAFGHPITSVTPGPPPQRGQSALRWENAEGTALLGLWQGPTTVPAGVRV